MLNMISGQQKEVLMIEEEIIRKWIGMESVKGISFLLNDSVQVITGDYAGKQGSVISLIDTEPLPVYLVELNDGKDIRVKQSEIIALAGEDPGMELMWLQKWYSAQCNGEWEHDLGIRIETLDNPGWLVTIDLKGTFLESVSFRKVEINNEREWIECKIEDTKFCGAGGPHMLCKIIEIFKHWADSIEK